MCTDIIWFKTLKLETFFSALAIMSSLLQFHNSEIYYFNLKH